MTVDITAGQVLPALTEDEARRLTERIRLTAGSVADGIEKLVGLVDQAQAGQAHLALGYASWTAYVSEEFADALPRLDMNARREITAELRQHGMSTRAIAPVVGVDEKTVRNDLRAAGADFSAPVQGRDGKTYTPPPRRPEPEIVDAELVEDPAVTEHLDSSQSVQDANYVHAFAKALSRGHDWLGYDPDRVAQLVDEAEFDLLVRHVQSAQRFLESARSSRRGLRAINGGNR